MKRVLPLLKEYRLKKILTKCLICFDRNAFDRTKQRDCILSLYATTPNKDLSHWDKSIFRGMVIPSLKYLGLIYGERDELRVTTNGKLIVESQKMDQAFRMMVLRAIVFEIDIKIFNFLTTLCNYRDLPKSEFLELMGKEVAGYSEKQIVERVNKWLFILGEVGLITLDISIKADQNGIKQLNKGTNPTKKQMSSFEREFFESYKKLAVNSAGIVKIEDIRKEVCLDLLREGKILTSSQFDILFRRIPFESEKYIFSLGKPMGAQDNLFEYSGSYFNTVYIKFKR